MVVLSVREVMFVYVWTMASRPLFEDSCGGRSVVSTTLFFLDYKYFMCSGELIKKRNKIL